MNVRINVEYEVEVPLRDEAASRPPLIPVCGFWLPDYGFHRGTAVRVFAKYGEIRLVLEEGGAVHEPHHEEPRHHGNIPMIPLRGSTPPCRTQRTGSKRLLPGG